MINDNRQILTVAEGFKEGRAWKIPKQVVIDYVEKHRRK